MFRMTIRILLPDKKASGALNILRPIVEQNRLKTECLSSHLYVDIENKDTILIDEMWIDQDTLETHLCSEEYYNLLLVIEMATEQPEIRFDRIASSTGVETIEKARKNL